MKENKENLFFNFIGIIIIIIKIIKLIRKKIRTLEKHGNGVSCVYLKTCETYCVSSVENSVVLPPYNV